MDGSATFEISTWGGPFNPYNVTHSLNICKTLRKYIFGHAKGKSLVNFYIVKALGQNLANSESCPILRLQFQVICQQMAMFE